jgi:penicillin amidase
MSRASAHRRRRCRAAALLLIPVGVLAVVMLGGWMLLRASLPQLDGVHDVTGVSAPVTIERDALGVPTLRGATRDDVAYATGFVHAQDRFFQMDLLRRVAAGEVSELVGSSALELDRRDRPHGFRARAKAIFDGLPAVDRQLIERYAAGVNDGLASLGARPFEYWLLQTRPAAWRPEDTLLVVYAMYFDLQSHEVSRILSRDALRERVPTAMIPFLLPPASHWDAPFDETAAHPASGPAESLPLPPSMRPDWLKAARTSSGVGAMFAGPGEVFSGRGGTSSGFDEASTRLGEPVVAAAFDDVQLSDSTIGSNGWVVDGTHSAQRGAILASDMHLGLSLPNIWYRVSLVYPSADGGARRITGVSLPGAPLVIAGSNGRVAWGFTNSYGRFIDLIELKRDPSDPLRYRVPDGGWERAIVHEEQIAIKGGAPVDLPVVETRWGPQIEVGSHAYALRWVAHDREAVNLNLRRLEDSATVQDALRVAQQSGIPTQNFMVGDASGSIGWTLAGPLPQRDLASGDFAKQAGDDASPGGAQPPALEGLPFASDTYRGWQRYLAPDAYPVRIDPPSGRLWTANNRALPLAEARRLGGDAGADVGARATQISDDLFALSHATERDMLSIQTDDRARWIEPWRRIALDALDAAALKDHPQRAEFRRLVQTWDGRADVDAVGYRLLRALYFSIYDAWFGKLDAQLAALGPGLGYRVANSRYLAVMEALAAQHAWLPDGVADWRAFVLERIDEVLTHLPAGTQPADARWGERNRAAIEHPFARMVPAWLPWVRDWLAVPRDPLPGDINMPRVQAPAFGASERMVVSPGREQDGIFEMPGGQSGHPLSPYFSAGHRAWVRGEATAFLPGATVHRLTLLRSPDRPAGS